MHNHAWALSAQRNADEQAEEEGLLQGQSRQGQRPRPSRHAATGARPPRPQTKTRRQAGTQTNPRRPAGRHRRPMKTLRLSALIFAAVLATSPSQSQTVSQTIQVNKDNRTIAITATDKVIVMADTATVHIGFIGGGDGDG